MSCSLVDVSVSTEKNKMIIRGCLAKIGVPSSGIPTGADTPIVFTQESVQACGKSYEGMPVNTSFSNDWDAWIDEFFTGHGGLRIGFIRSVEAEGENLMAEVVIWKEAYPTISQAILNAVDALGFSIECYSTREHVEDGNTVIDEFEGVGCAILFKNRAAFSDTFIEKLAAGRKDVDNKMDEKKIEQMVDGKIEAAMTQVKELIEANRSNDVADLANSVAEMKEAMNGFVGKDVVQSIQDSVAEIKAQAEEIPIPKAGQKVEEKFVEGDSSKEKKIAEINASAMTEIEKVKAITKVRLG